MSQIYSPSSLSSPDSGQTQSEARDQKSPLTSIRPDCPGNQQGGEDKRVGLEGKQKHPLHITREERWGREVGLAGVGWWKGEKMQTIVTE